MMALWPEERGRRMANSVAWRRARDERKAAFEKHALIASDCGQDAERFLWALLVLQTRAINLSSHGADSSGHVVVPGVDLANHRSVGATARFAVEKGHVQLRANVALQPGDEVT